MDKNEQELRSEIISYCLQMNECGINQGTSGNISARFGDGMLITPTSIAYDKLGAEDIVYVGPDGTSKGRHKPSSEWRFHRDILTSRPDANAVVHTHPVFCTAFAIHGREIPAVHYMIAAAGGGNIRCAPYAIYGSQDLSDFALTALKDRTACLLEHHGMIAIGSSLEQALWRAIEVETLAKQYHAALQIGEPPLLSSEQVQKVIDKISGYGLQD